MSDSNFQAIQWNHGTLTLLDQRKLPLQEIYLDYQSAEDIAQAITDMVVRGAPAIGITAAYGVVVAARNAFQKSRNNWKDSIQSDIELLRLSRPTAVNLFWALDRMQAIIDSLNEEDPTDPLEKEAIDIHYEDIAANRTMGKLGAGLIAEDVIKDNSVNILTHCNTGSLATGGYGTALGVIRTLSEQNLLDRVFADETRPWLQGSRLTAWELQRDGIPVSLNADGAAAWLMASKNINWVIVGADRITANGDAANKIGTYSLAVLAKYHNVKFMVVAPSTTIDMELESGAQIEIEHRDPQELTKVADRDIANPGTDAINPVFDVTPASLIDAIVTEKGIVQQPDTIKMKALFS